MDFKLLLIFLLLSSQAISQISVSLTPSRQLYFTSISGMGNTDDPNIDDLAAVSEQNSPFQVGQTLIDFNLDSILPPNAFILNASLNLYANPNPTVSSGHENSGNNSTHIIRVLAPWDQVLSDLALSSTVTTANRVILPPSTISDQDYLNIDFTTLARNMINSSTSNNGLLFQLPFDFPGSAMNFAGRNNPDPMLRPTLNIEYSEPTCDTLKTGVDNNFALYISDFPGLESTNLNDIEDVAAISDTEMGLPYLGRSLLKFDITSIPNNATIVGATLDLFGNPTPEVSLGHNFRNINTTEIVRALEPWDELTTTWTNQPAIDPNSGIQQRALVNRFESTLDIDLTELVSDFHQNPQSDFGVMLKLLLEEDERGVNYAGNINLTLRPTLKVCYEPLTSIEVQDDFISLDIHPIPASENISIEYTLDQEAQVTLLNVKGQQIKRFKIYEGTQMNYDLDISAYPTGTYVLNFRTEEQEISKKLIISR